MVRKNGSKKSTKTAETAAVYRGPIISRQDRGQSDAIEVLVSFTGSIASNGAGAIVDVIGNDPSASGDFASYQNIYDEFRVLGEQLEYFPNDRYSKATTKCTPLIVVKDRNDTAALASYSSAIQYASAEKRSIEDPWIEQMRMVGIEDAGFISTASPAANRWFKFYGDGLTVSTTYGRYFFYMRVQFRGRK